MSALLDTSVVVRYLLDDPPDLAQTAMAIIESDEDLVLTDVILAEVAYVLTSVYRVPRTETVDYLLEFVQRSNLRVAGIPKGLILEALLLCRPSGRVSFADALLWAAARARGIAVYSLDERFPQDGIVVLRSR